MDQSSATTILVVDDHDAFRASAGRLLASLGFDVVGEAADGESAIAAVDELRPDAILLDVQLPDIDGFEVTERILRRHGDEYSPIVVLTSSRERADYGSSVDDCGCAGFIAKSDLANGAISELLK